jgi:hypothetical protein
MFFGWSICRLAAHSEHAQARAVAELLASWYLTEPSGTAAAELGKQRASDPRRGSRRATG